MSWRKSALLALSVSMLCSCGGAVTTKIVIPESAIEKAMHAYFPLSSEKLAEEDAPVIVTLTEPDAILTAGSDRLQVRMKINVRRIADVPLRRPIAGAFQPKPPGLPVPGRPRALPREAPAELPEQALPGLRGPRDNEGAAETPTEFEGYVTVAGEIEYNNKEGAFYIRNPTIDEMTLKLLPEPLKKVAKGVTERVLTRYLHENSVYTLSDDDARIRAAKMLLNSVSIQDGKMVVELGL